MKNGDVSKKQLTPPKKCKQIYMQSWYSPTQEKLTAQVKKFLKIRNKMKNLLVKIRQ